MDEISDLRRHAIPLAGLDREFPDDDRAPLLQRLGEARVVGLGEATHGDHESFAMKSCLIRALVRQYGFNLLIFERGVAEMDAYDRYINGQTRTAVIADTKALIWAYNGHVYHEAPVAGSYLSTQLGTAYRSICCVFGSGRFNAGRGRINLETKLPEGQIDWTLRPCDADPPPEESLEWVLGQAGLACFAVEPARVTSLRQERPLRNVGVAVFEGLGQFSHRCVPASVLDTLVYFRQVHPSFALPPGAARCLP